jgi:hypothetical protein
MPPDENAIEWRDEIVEEVRRIREEHAARFNYDIAAIVADARRRQQEGGRKVVSFVACECKPEEKPTVRAQ